MRIYPAYTVTQAVHRLILIRMLSVGYCLGIRSKRRLCAEIYLNLACRWFLRFDLAERVPNHSAFSKNRPFH